MKRSKDLLVLGRAGKLPSSLSIHCQVRTHTPVFACRRRILPELEADLSFKGTIKRWDRGQA